MEKASVRGAAATQPTSGRHVAKLSYLDGVPLLTEVAVMVRTSRHRFAGALALVASLFALPIAHAATFCVPEDATLPQALAAWAASDEGTTTVKVEKNAPGTVYSINGGWSQNYRDPQNAGALVLRGGYARGSHCQDTPALDPSATVIDGGNVANGTFHLDANGPVTIRGITFQRFLGRADGTESINLWGNFQNAALDVDHVRYAFNSHVDITSPANVALREVLVYGQPASAASTVALRAHAYGHQLTMAGLTVTHNAGSGIEIGTESGGETYVFNSILWGNSGTDVEVSGVDGDAPTILYSIVNSANVLADQVNTLHPPLSSPMFIDDANNDYRLIYSPPSISPAINAGTQGVIDGLEQTDITGRRRTIGSHPDIGAYESSVDDLHNFDVTDPSDNGSNANPTQHTLRWALKSAHDAHASGVPGSFSIHFGLPCGGLSTVSAAAPMPVVDYDLTIDGTTNAGWTANTRDDGFDAHLCAAISGGNAVARLLDVTGNGRLTATGLLLIDFTAAPIRLGGGENHIVQGNELLTSVRGVEITGASGTAYIGGPDTEQRNLIAGNSGPGVYITSTNGGSVVSNNLIGLQGNGAAPFPNGFGVYVLNSPNNTIANNTISASTNAAVMLNGASTVGNTVQLNRIGYAEVGAADVSNGAQAINVQNGAHHNTIGATLGNEDRGNSIRSDGTGVWVQPTAGVGNAVTANSILAGLGGNAGIAIDIDVAGPTANVAGDAAQNFPTVVQSFRTVSLPSVEWVKVSIDSDPLESLLVDLYASDALFASQTGRGNLQTYLGRGETVPDGSGHSEFWVRVEAPPLASSLVSATATTLTGDTSEPSVAVAEIMNDMLFRDDFDSH